MAVKLTGEAMKSLLKCKLELNFNIKGIENTITISAKIRLDGRMTVPKPDLSHLEMPKVYQEFKGLLVRSVEPEEKENVKNYMLKNFYRTAIVPKALNLQSTSPKYKHLSDELDLMLDSRTSFITESNKDIIGAIINTVWPVEKTEQELDLDPVEYLNLASEIACESTKDSDLRAVLWRQLQFELIYHLIQKHARKNEAELVLYGGMGYNSPEIRDKGSTAMFLAGGQQWASLNKTCFTFMGTYPGFADMMERNLPGMFETVAYIPYSELKVTLHSDVCVFKDIDDGMILMGSK